MRYIQTILAVVLYIGTVDSIDSEMASVEVTVGDEKTHQFEMPTLVFPCKIREGDVFYFLYENDVTEIRCGEPPI